MARTTEVLTVEELAAALARRSRQASSAPGRTRIVAVDGWSGSGKTSLADRLAPALGAPCVHLDDWVPGWEGLQRSVELLVEWVLTPLSEGRPARWRCWDWDRDRFGTWVVQEPADLIVVEGCGSGSALARPWLSCLVWIALDEDRRQERLRARPDWPTYAPWAEMWMRQERALRAGEDPTASADAVLRSQDGVGATLEVTWST